MIKTKTMKSDEKEFLNELRQGSQKAFAILVDTYQKKLLNIAYGITLDKEDSIEIVQDVFVSVYENINSFREESGLFTWMRKITVNLSLNWKRKWKRRFRFNQQSNQLSNHQSHQLNIDVEPIKQVDRDLFSAFYDDIAETPESQYIELESEQILMEHINKLPEKVRSVLVLKVFEKMSYEEIADSLSINIGTVKSRIHHAREFLIKSAKVGNCLEKKRC